MFAEMHSDLHEVRASPEDCLGENQARSETLQRLRRKKEFLERQRGCAAQGAGEEVLEADLASEVLHAEDVSHVSDTTESEAELSSHAGSSTGAGSDVFVEEEEDTSLPGLQLAYLRLLEQKKRLLEHQCAHARLVAEGLRFETPSSDDGLAEESEESDESEESEEESAEDSEEEGSSEEPSFEATLYPSCQELHSKFEDLQTKLSLLKRGQAEAQERLLGLQTAFDAVDLGSPLASSSASSSASDEGCGSECSDESEAAFQRKMNLLRSRRDPEGEERERPEGSEESAEESEDESEDEREDSEEEDWRRRTDPMVQPEEEPAVAALGRAAEAAKEPPPAVAECGQELAFRPRNVRPLGALQPEGFISWTRPTAVAAVSARFRRNLPRGICAFEASGVDGEAVRDWLQGQISGALCLARVLEGIRWGRWSSRTRLRNLSSTEDLYREGSSSGFGGVLGGMVGGLPRALAADTSSLFGGILTSGGPVDALAGASIRLREDAGVADSAEDICDSLSEQQINLAFQRRCIKSHPQREQGHLQEYLRAHLDHEILRQKRLLEGERSLGSESTDSADRGLSDGELTEELGKEDSAVLAEGKAATAEDQKRWEGNVSSHILWLSWQKEVLEAVLSELKSHGAYAVLGVAPEASDAELARAYKAQALRLHPDRAGGSNDAFQALQAAYESVLEQRGCRGSGSKPSEEKEKARTKPKASAGQAGQAGQAEKSAEVAKEVAKESVKEEPQKAAKEEAREGANHDSEEEAAEEMLDKDEKVAEEVAEEGAKEVAVEATSEAVAGDQAESELDAHADPRLDASMAADGADAAAQEADEPTLADSRAADREAEGSCHCEEDERPAVAGSRRRRQSESIPEVNEETLVALVSKIPAEAISRQAELALDGARMCCRMAGLCKSIAETTQDHCWPQLLRLATQALEVANHVGEAADCVGQQALRVPHEMIPVLDAVSKAGTNLRDGLAKQVMEGAKGLIKSTEQVSDLGQSTLFRSVKLMSHTSRMVATLREMAELPGTRGAPSASIAGLVDTVAWLAADTAEAVGAAAVAVGDAQQTARNFVDVLQAAGAWSKGKDDGKGDEDEAAEAGSKSPRSADEAESAKEPCDERLVRHKLLLRLNTEVLRQQQELRGLVLRSPALIEAVSTGQKGALFEVVAEVLEGARGSVSTAWRNSLISSESGKEAFVDSVEGALGFVFAAAAWEKLAVPSLEARLLRMASLLDGRLLRQMLSEDLFKHAVALAPDEHGIARKLAKRLDAAANSMQLGFAFAGA